MTSRKLYQYKGPLSPTQVAEGMNAARRNARRLAADARYLLEEQRYGSAAALAVLSIEESGKGAILRSIALDRTDEERRKSWKDFRSHTKKNFLGGVPAMLSQGARQFEDFRPLFNGGSDVSSLLDQVKQVATYSDCLGDIHWSEPEIVIAEGLARSLVAIADSLSSKGQVTAREIELWVEHVGPVWRGSTLEMKRALLNWFAAMNAEGLQSNKSDVVEQFIWGEEVDFGGDCDA